MRNYKNLYVHYGESGGDSPTAEELEKLLEK